jgi:hypothetical protein
LLVVFVVPGEEHLGGGRRGVVEHPIGTESHHRHSGNDSEQDDRSGDESTDEHAVTEREAFARRGGIGETFGDLPGQIALSRISATVRWEQRRGPSFLPPPRDAEVKTGRSPMSTSVSTKKETARAGSLLLLLETVGSGYGTHYLRVWVLLLFVTDTVVGVAERSEPFGGVVGETVVG